MSKEKKSHGLYLKQFDESEQTLEDFVRCFKLGRRALLKNYRRNSPVEVLEVMFDKDDYIMRKVKIAEDTILFKFKKYTEEEEDYTELADMIEAIRNKRDNGGY